ncbi:Arginyl-tRNA--protein transferase 1 isoform 3 [Schistosoma japonicum]|uniref:Arginyl-tRNA--protein transferase 1 n=2 Tax=Schistosoma japonicum TaxID=6182 RepID=A0A4Z2CPJ4_SCHJA|nr:Arginyl-tRNA--protein transferase 1 isoform 3 [Schistosoma japonicum]
MTSCANSSLVIPYGPHSSGACGYCKNSSNGKNTWGMMAERLTVSDYQYLIDRGWRRSGTYCYKPLNEITCCPSYTIRCDALHFRLKKSHKKVLKNMSDFLRFGKLPDKKFSDQKGVNSLKMDDHREFILDEKELPVLSPKNVDVIQQEQEKIQNHTKTRQIDGSGDNKFSLLIHPPSTTHFILEEPDGGNIKFQSVPSSGDGVRNSPLVNRRTKAHVRRWIAKQERLRQRSLKENRSFETLLQEYNERRQKRLVKNRPKQIEDLLECEPVKGEGVHFIEIRLIRTTPPSNTDYESSTRVSYEIYQQYQMHVHNDEKKDCTLEQFQRFLVKSPLVLDNSEWNTTSPMFGSYHQQYWLDGEKLIAVGVIDLLPQCLSSVYVFYDPYYSSLHLGTYTALREIAFVRHLSKTYGPNSLQPDPMYSNFSSYYMGYYIHTCRKMSYKAHYGPAYLACPETFNWVPINDCIEALNNLKASKYTRFSPPSTIDVDAIPETIDIDTLDSHIYFYVKYNNNKVFDTSTTTAKEDFIHNPSVSLLTLRSHLNKRAIPVFREWAKLLGKRALSGHFLIIINAN